jgi:hypothetical protein
MTDGVNPYSPPAVETATEAVTTGRGAIRFDEFEEGVIRTMSKGMKVVSLMQYAAALLLGVLIVALILTSGVGRMMLGSNPVMRLATGVPVYVMGVMLLLVVVAATWLMQSSRSFVRSLEAGTTDGLARGFQKLYLYLILYGVYSIITLGLTVVSMVGAVALLRSGL